MKSKYWLAFSSIEQVDSRFIKRLFDYFGDIEDAFNSSINELSHIDGLSIEKAENFVKLKKEVNPDKVFEEIEKRQDRDILLRIKASLSHLEINGPNTILGVLPTGEMLCVCDAKKLRPVVIGRTDDTVIMTSEVTGINDILPGRDYSLDIYPDEKETVIVKNDLTVEEWKQ